MADKASQFQVERMCVYNSASTFNKETVLEDVISKNCDIVNISV